MDNTIERITHEKGDHDAWTCICGNVPSGNGFYPCNNTAEEVEPVDGKWDGKNYGCSECGRIIDFETLEVVGRGTFVPLP